MGRLRIALRSFADFEAALAAQLSAFRQVDPNTEFEPVALELRQLEREVLDGALAKGSWDLVIFPTDWLGAAIESSALELLTPWFVRHSLPGWPEGWPVSLTEPLQCGEDFYCIPWHDGPECLIYRSDLFSAHLERELFKKRYGRELAPPATWTEFSETARFFTRPAEELFGTIFAAYPDGHNTLYDLVLQVWSRGGELYDGGGLPTLNRPEAVEALDYYREIIRDPRACYPGAHEIDSLRSGEVFLSGRIAMMVNWFGFAARCNRPDSTLRGKIGLAPIPGGQLGQSASLSNYWVIGIGAGSAHKATAYRVLQHIASPDMDKVTTLNGAVGVRLSTWSNPEIEAAFPLYRDLEGLSARARTLPFCKDLPKLAEIMNRVAVEALGTNETSASILQRAQEQALRDKLELKMPSRLMKQRGLS